MTEDVQMEESSPNTTSDDADYVMVQKSDAMDDDEDVADLQSSLDATVELIKKHQLGGTLQELAHIDVPKVLISDILGEELGRYSMAAVAIKEQAIYNLTKFYSLTGGSEEVVGMLTGEACGELFKNVTKAKCARVIRQVLDLVCDLLPDNLAVQEVICRQIIEWCTEQKRSFLRQRVEAKLATVLYAKEEYVDALKLIDSLLTQLKKLDDKQLLVETHLIESKIHFALHGFQKSKAALTASRTAANSIYVGPRMQATIDLMSGTLHCEEGDYDTAHSYFLEAFEQLDQLDDTERALPCLKYMMLCKTLDALGRALKISAIGGIGKISKTKLENGHFET